MQEARILGSIVNALIAIELIIALIFLVPFSMWGFGALGFLWALILKPESQILNIPLDPSPKAEVLNSSTPNHVKPSAADVKEAF